MSDPGEGILICYPDALKTVEGRAEVIEALKRIADALDLDRALVPKPDKYGWVHFPVAHASLLVAMGQGVPDWRERGLFYPSDEIA